MCVLCVQKIATYQHVLRSGSNVDRNHWQGVLQDHQRDVQSWQADLARVEAKLARKEATMASLQGEQLPAPRAHCYTNHDLPPGSHIAMPTLHCR